MRDGHVLDVFDGRAGEVERAEQRAGLAHGEELRDVAIVVHVDNAGVALARADAGQRVERAVVILPACSAGP